MFIDIHAHTRRVPGYPRKWDGKTFATPEDLIQRWDELEVEAGVILPGVSPECARVPDSLEGALQIAADYAPRFIPFCNVDPRALDNSPDAPLDEFLQFYKEKGMKGIGEVTANLPFDHPLVMNLFRCAEKVGDMPLTFHIGPALGGCYGLYDQPGLPLLEKALQAFPGLTFLGHSQPFWAEIGVLAAPDGRMAYPEGPVAGPGRVVELMRKYANLHGDLSANSGYNALKRDEAFAGEFLEEFQDRLYFGTDIGAPDTPAPLAPFLLYMRDEGKISEEIFCKIARENAARLLGL